MSDLVDHYDFYAEKGKVEPPKKGQTYLNEEELDELNKKWQEKIKANSQEKNSEE